MKNMFGIDITEDKNNDRFDGEGFAVRKLSEKLTDDLTSIAKEKESYENQVTMPTVVMILYWICIMLGSIVLISALRTGFDIKDIMEKAPAVLVIGIVSWVYVGAVKLYERRKVRKVAGSEDFAAHIEAADAVISAVTEELRIPENSARIDVIVTKHKIKNGVDKKQNFNPMFSDWVEEMFLFREGDMLCLADLMTVYGIPFSALGEMTLNKKRAMYPVWTKEEAWNSETYKPYKIRVNNQGCYFVLYYSVAIKTEAGEFELLIPNYDQLSFTEISGVQPAES